MFFQDSKIQNDFWKKSTQQTCISKLIILSSNWWYQRSHNYRKSMKNMVHFTEETHSHKLEDFCIWCTPLYSQFPPPQHKIMILWFVMYQFRTVCKEISLEIYKKQAKNEKCVLRVACDVSLSGEMNYNLWNKRIALGEAIYLVLNCWTHKPPQIEKWVYLSHW